MHTGSLTSPAPKVAGIRPAEAPIPVRQIAARCTPSPTVVSTAPGTRFQLVLATVFSRTSSAASPASMAPARIGNAWSGTQRRKGDGVIRLLLPPPQSRGELADDGCVASIRESIVDLSGIASEVVELVLATGMHIQLPAAPVDRTHVRLGIIADGVRLGLAMPLNHDVRLVWGHIAVGEQWDQAGALQMGWSSSSRSVGTRST